MVLRLVVWYLGHTKITCTNNSIPDSIYSHVYLSITPGDAGKEHCNPAKHGIWNCNMGSAIKSQHEAFRVSRSNDIETHTPAHSTGSLHRMHSSRRN